MRMAEMACRSTLHSTALEFALRIFDRKSCGLRAEELVQGGIDGPLWQTSRAYLRPKVGLATCARNTHGWR
jgi:hypothetical protein